MKLRKKVTIIIGITLIGLILSMYSISYLILGNDFALLEEQNVSRNVQRAVDSIYNDINAIGSLVKDWSYWDDTYEFIEDENSEYIKANLVESSFLSGKLNLLMLIHSSGKIVYANGFDFEKQEIVPISGEIQKKVLSSKLFFSSPDAKEGEEGLINFPEGPMLIAAYPILSSEIEGPARGSVVMGRYLDSTEVERLAQLTKLSITIDQIDEKTNTNILNNDEINIQILDNEKIQGYTFLKDVFNNSVLKLSINSPRDIFNHGMRSIQLLTSLVLVSGLVIGLIILILLEKTVLSRISYLGNIANRITETGNLSERVRIKGKDEISDLADNINIMISSLEKSQHELIQSKETAEAASKAKSEFLANMSHEIRTPMNGIIGMTELVLETETTKQQKEYLSMVKSSADGLLQIINNILDFSKIEAGKFELDNVEFDLRNTIEKTAEIFALRAHQKGIELICDIQTDVPTDLIGDPGRLNQILINLVGNAIKFTEKGEVVLKVEKLAVNSKETEIKFSVKDTGIGIPEDKMGRLFKSFSQVDGSYARQYGGTGLGLAISKQLIGLMGGNIWVESKNGEGSTFLFTAIFKVQDEKQHKEEQLEIKDLRVLVIDDNETNRIILRDMLQKIGISIESASNGEEGINILKVSHEIGRPINLILMDAQMPGMDGFEVTEYIRKNHYYNKVIIMILTSVGMPGDIARCKELGISIYLIKPIKRVELIHAIKNVLNKDNTDELSKNSNSDDEKLYSNEVTENLYRSKVKILLAEDNIINQKLAAALIKKKGWEVEVADNGKKALEKLEKETYDIILMDIQMPEMDGFEATMEIRKREKYTGGHIPIVAMTANAMKGDKEKCLEAGMDDYVSKPIKPDEFYSVVDNTLQMQHIN